MASWRNEGAVMGDLANWVAGLVSSSSEQPLWLRYPQPPESEEGSELVKDVDYFRVRVHRINLAHDTTWFQRYAAVLVVATQYSYDGQVVTKPAVVGPSLIEALGVPANANPEIVGPVVAGPHPLVDPNLTVTISLQKVAREDRIAPLLSIVEGAAKALDLLSGLTPFAAVARIVVDGVNALTGGDAPVLARQVHLSPVRTSYYAAVAAAPEVDRGTLFVREDDLVHEVDGAWVPFRSADFVLFSIDRVAPADIDVSTLPLDPLWRTARDNAMNALDDQRNAILRSSYLALLQAAEKSPDLTAAHRPILQAYWHDRLVALRSTARSAADLGGAHDALDPALVRALSALEL
jgi:hypothetical protein